MDIKAQGLRVSSYDRPSFGGGDDVRQFSLMLAKLDVPIPMTPGGGDPHLKYVMTTAAAEQNCASIIGRPIRMSESLDSHSEVDVQTGKKRLAPIFGHIQNSYVKEMPDGNYWMVDGVWYASQNKALTDAIVNNLDLIGGSYEISKTGDWPVEGDTVMMNHFRATGAAILARDKAAYQHMTRMIYAEAYPELLQLAAEAQDAAIEKIELLGDEFLRQLTTDGGDPAEARQEPVEPVVEPDLQAQYGEPGPPDNGGEGVQMEELEKRLEALLAEKIELSSALEQAKSGLKERDDKLAVVASALSVEGVESVAGLIDKYKTVTAELEAQVADKNGKLSAALEDGEKLTAECSELRTKVAETEAAIEFEKIKDTIEAGAQEKVLDIMKRAARGESVGVQELTLMAAARTVPAVPDGTQISAEAHAEAPTSEGAGGSTSYAELFAEAAEKYDNSEERLAYINKRMQELGA